MEFFNQLIKRTIGIGQKPNLPVVAYSYYDINRREVLRMYRKYHHILPNSCTSELQKATKLSELRYFFKKSQSLEKLHEIEYYKELGYYVLNKIEKKEYPPFPQYIDDNIALFNLDDIDNKDDGNMRIS